MYVPAARFVNVLDVAVELEAVKPLGNVNVYGLAPPETVRVELPVFVPVVAFDGQTGCVVFGVSVNTEGSVKTTVLVAEQPKSLKVTVTLYVPAFKPVKVFDVVV